MSTVITDRELQFLVHRARAVFEARDPTFREDLRRAQADSWVRGEMSLSASVGKRYADGGVVYEDYAGYCLD